MIDLATELDARGDHFPGQSPTGATPSGDSPVQSAAEAFLDLLDQGYWSIGVYPPGIALPARPKPTEGKEPIGKGWGEDRWTWDRWRRAAGQYKGAGVGVCLGPGRGPEGTWLVDIEGDGPEAEASRNKLFGGEIVETRGWSSSRGRHALLACDPARLAEIMPRLAGLESKGATGTGVYKSDELPGLELRIGGYKVDGTVKQVQSVVPPTVGTNGHPRAWTGPTTVAEIPGHFYDFLTSLAPISEVKHGARPGHQSHRARVSSAGRGRSANRDAELAAEALTYLDPSMGYLGWLNVGMALTSLGHEGLALWDSWSHKSDKHTQGECSQKWASFDDMPGGVTLGTLFHMAKDNGFAIEKFAPSDKGSIAEWSKLRADVQAKVEAGDFEGIYGSRSLLMWIARLKDGDPGLFTILRQAFKLKAKEDDRFSPRDLDEAIKSLASEAKKANTKEVRHQQVAARGGKKGGDHQPTEGGVGAESSKKSERVNGEPLAEDVSDWVDEHDQQQADLAESRTFSNFELVEGVDKEGNPLVKPVPLSIHRVDEALAAVTPSNLLRRVGGSLFTESADHDPVWIDRQARMFALIGRMARIEWSAKQGCVSHDEYFEHQRMTADCFGSIETMPHEPSMPGVCYMYGAIPEPSGKLDKLVEYFVPETTADRDLIKALIVTAFWGGQCGQRPAFLVSGPADDPLNGVGVGKSTLLDVVADELCGGSVDVSSNDDMAGIKTRLLSESASQLRFIRIDNLKSLKLSWAELESLITASEVSGKCLYKGNGRRPNNLMVVVTVNGASLSRDMAQRVVTITLRRPEPRAGWVDEVRAFAKAHRWSIIAECLEILRKDTRTIKATSRWAAWEADVLDKVASDLKACQDRIGERRAEGDADESEAADVRDQFVVELRARGHQTDEACVLIPSAVAAEWLSTAVRKHYATPQSSAHLRVLSISELKPSRSDTERGWIWKGAKATSFKPGPLNKVNFDRPK